VGGHGHIGPPQTKKSGAPGPPGHTVPTPMRLEVDMVKHKREKVENILELESVETNPIE